jgi:hypothetical protein
MALMHPADLQGACLSQSPTSRNRGPQSSAQVPYVRHRSDLFASDHASQERNLALCSTRNPGPLDD